MDLALKAAENAGKSGEVPIGCVIVRDNDVIAAAGNRTLTDRDPTAHAEMLAIRLAAEVVGSERLVDCDLYVTLEPVIGQRFALTRWRMLTAVPESRIASTSPPRPEELPQQRRGFALADRGINLGDVMAGRRGEEPHAEEAK